MNRSIASALIVLGIVVSSAPAQGEPEVVARIIEAGTADSRAWDYLEHMSVEIGPRLTGSTNLARANGWTRDEFARLGLHNAHLAKWGEIAVRFDRGSSSARMVEPVERDFEFTAQAWSAGTDGPVRGRVVKAPTTLEDLETIRGDLAGAWVLSKQPARRRRRGRSEEARQAAEDARKLRDELDTALRKAGIAGRLYASSSDLVRTGGARGWREMDYHALPEDVSVSIRRIDYDAMNSRLADGETVEVEIDLEHHFVEGPFPVFNVIAEIPGTERPEEVVIISGHIDTWDGPGTQGAQDNGTGVAVALEAARILMAAEAKPKRTIRFILWGGEEQGLLGSSAYVKSLSDEERAAISAAFVEDGGTNYEGGLSCIESMKPMLEAAVAPVSAAFPDMPVEIAVRERMSRGGGSDHSPFNRAGIPGFFWHEKGSGGQEGKNYRFIHHTQHDTVRYVVPEYMVQSAVCSAVTAYNLAMADTLLPRQEPEAPAEATPEPSAAPAPSADAEPTIAAEDAPWQATEGPLSGTWTAMLTGDDAPPDAEFTLTFEMSADGRARGAIESPYEQGKLEQVAWDADTGKVTFVRQSEDMGTIKFQATVAGDAMTGTLDLAGEFKMQFRATRVKEQDIAAADAGAARGNEEGSPDHEDENRQDHEDPD